MEQQRIEKLIEDFHANRLSADEQKDLEKLIERGEVDLESFGQLEFMQGQIQRISYPSPSPELDDRFYHMLAIEKRSRSSFSWREFFSWPSFAPKLAFASVTLILGVAIGYYAKPFSQGSDDMQALREQVTDLKEMMMLSLLEKESATERLKAVSLTEQMDYASAEVTTALLETLNHDENVNVRLAALDALRPYTQDSNVRTELVRAIAMQDSPLVQIALAELMAEIQERKSVNELEKIIQSERTPSDVKKKIRESIKVLS